MAEVIFMTIQRGVHHYHRIESFPVTVGRALDNDVILQDVTVSPHHLVIEKEHDKLYLRNISLENGTKIDGKKMSEARVEVETPSNFQLSNIKARLLATDMIVEETHVKECSGFFCIFSNPLWAISLLAITIGLFVFERYVNTPAAKEVYFYLNTVLPSVWIILGITVLIAGISRLAAHRWEIVPAISIASLIFLLPQLFEYLGQFSAYLFTNDTLSIYLEYASKFLVIPALITAFIVKTINAKWISATGIAVLIYSPFLAYQVLILIDELSFKSGFSEIPSYSQTLLPGDKRLNTTIPLEQFIKEAERATSLDVEQMLIEAKKKEREES